MAVRANRPSPTILTRTFSAAAMSRRDHTDHHTRSFEHEEVRENEMVDILHRVGITATVDKVYEALTTIEALAAWWTTDTSGDGDGVLQFRFGDVGGFDMKVVDLQPNARVRWEVVEGPAEW